MIKFTLVLACFLISHSTFSQTTALQSSQQADPSLIVYKTLKISTSAYSDKLILNLSDELAAWKGKVIAADIDQTTKTFTLKHNRYMNEKELFEVLDKYAITKTSIISYQ